MICQNENHNTVRENGSHMQAPPVMGLVPESLVRIIWRGRWIVLLATVVALVAALVYITKATPIYTSTSRVYVEQSGPKIFSETEDGVMTQSKNYLYTQAELLKSTPIIAAVVGAPGASQMQTFARVDNPMAYLKKNMDATVGKKDDIISVSFDSPYPAEAARLVNAVVDSYITYHATRKRSTSAEVLAILQNEKAKRGKELSERLKAVIDFKKENEALAFEGSKGNIIIERLERLSSVLTETQLATIEAQTTCESVKEMVSDPTGFKQLIEAQRAKELYRGTPTVWATLKSRLAQLQLDLVGPLHQHANNHSALVAVENQIVQVKAQIADLDTEFARGQLAAVEQQYLAAKQKEAQIAKYFDQQRQQVLDLSEQLGQYAILQSDWDQTKKLCEILDDRIKELNVTEDVGALNISVLEVARAEPKPSEPQKARVMAIALVMGLMLGGGLALLRDWMDQRLRSAEEISAILDLPDLGVVPSMSKKQSMVARAQKVHETPDSPVAEAYRTIRTAVFFGAPKSEAKTILITSPTPSDGKSTLASNLAIAMAQAGQRTLILDADLRRPVQHKAFGISSNDGLTCVLAEMTTLEEAIQPTRIEGLELLTCGPKVDNPSEILNSTGFGKALEHLSNKYDRIIIDAPPVMPVTDARILAAICNITLLVLRAEKSTRKTSQQARYGLMSVGGRVLGAIVNDVPKKSRYGYDNSYGYYNGYYGYGRDRTEKAYDRKPEPAREGIHV